jgi:hypothetical protein
MDIWTVDTSSTQSVCYASEDTMSVTINTVQLDAMIKLVQAQAKGCDMLLSIMNGHAMSTPAAKPEAKAKTKPAAKPAAKPVPLAAMAVPAHAAAAPVAVAIPLPAKPAAKPRKPSVWHFAALARLGMTTVQVGQKFAYTPRKTGVQGTWTVVSVDAAAQTVQAAKG